MSISSRITSMEQHIGNAYDKLDELGVDLTNVDKNLNNIAELLDGVYEEYPKIEENNVTEPSINNTKVGKMEIDLKGNTEQNGEPTPDNEIPVEVVSGENTVKVVNKNLFDNTAERINAYINATVGKPVTYTQSNATYVYKKCCKVKANTTYIISWEQSSTPASSNYRMGTVVDENNIALEALFNTWTPSPQYISITPTTTGYLMLGTDTNVTDIMIEEGSTATTYEEHKEQDFPISLKSRNLINTSDTKNAFLNVSTGTITTSGSWVTNWSFTNHIKINGDKLTLSFGEINTFQSKIGYYNANKEYISGVEGSYTSGTTFTVATNTKYIRFNYRNNVGATNIQLEEGSTATEYQPYYNYELCKIGDYQDYPWKDESTGKWYVHKMIDKVVLDGTQTSPTLNTSEETTTRLFYNYDLLEYNAKQGYGICNRLIQRNVWTGSNEGFYFDDNSKKMILRIRKAIIGTTENEVNSYLANNNIITYYVLATPTDIEITDTTLINQLEAIYNTAKSYDNVTNIIQENNNLPFILDIKTLKKS